MYCIFKESKYYKTATANPMDIAPPIGYDFLKSSTQVTLKSGELKLKELPGRPEFKILSTRKFPEEKLPEVLKISELPRKNEYMTPKSLTEMKEKYNENIYKMIVKCFLPKYKPEYKMVELGQLLGKGCLHVENYTLSKFIFMCFGTNRYQLEYLYNYFNRRLIEYEIVPEILVVGEETNIYPSESFTETHRFELTDITDINSVRRLGERILAKNKQLDELNQGLHFMFFDFVSEEAKHCDFFGRETKHYAFLQFEIALITSVLADGQSAIIRLGGCIKHKTFEYVFMLKIMFMKISFCKPSVTNFFEPDLYVICEGYQEETGKIVGKHLADNYHLLKEYGDDKFLLNPMEILKIQDFNTSVKSFNDSFYSRLREILKEFVENTNMEFYPEKTQIVERLPKFAMELEPIVDEMIAIKKEEKKEEAPNESINEENKRKQEENKKNRGALFGFGRK